MAEISPILAAFTVIVWPLFMGLCLWKYLHALKARKRLDAWIWFFACAICISAIEWWVLSAMILLRVF